MKICQYEFMERLKEKNIMSINHSESKKQKSYDEDFMSINYSECKEGVEDLYLQLYQELNTPLRMTGYIIEGEYDYEGYDFLDKCCIFIGLAKIAMDDNVDISEIQGELKEIFESNVIDGLKEKLGDDFEVFYNDYLKVQQEYKKL